MCFEQPGYWRECLPAEEVHKATWVPLDLSTENQIDHVCIGRKLRRSVQDVCVKRGADVASDHLLFIAKLKLRLKRNWTGESCQRPRNNTTMLLKDTTKQQEFKIVLVNKFQVLYQMLKEETINEKWQAIKESFTLTCKEVLGPKKQHHKEWFSAEMHKKIEERKRKKADINNSHTWAEKARAHEEYSYASKIAPKSIKADKREYMNMLATETEEQLTKEIYGDCTPPSRYCLESLGNQRDQ